MASKVSVETARARAAIKSMPNFVTGINSQSDLITQVNNDNNDLIKRRPLNYLMGLEECLLVNNSGYEHLSSLYFLFSSTTKVSRRNYHFESLGTTSDEAVNDPHTTKLQELRELPTDWNSYGAEPPNEDSYCWSKVILKTLPEIGLNLTKILPSAEGGIGIVFSRNGRIADIECLNSGEILAAQSDRQNEPEVWEIKPSSENIKKSLEKIRDFLSA